MHYEICSGNKNIFLFLHDEYLIQHKFLHYVQNSFILSVGMSGKEMTPPWSYEFEMHLHMSPTLGFQGYELTSCSL